MSAVERDRLYTEPTGIYTTQMPLRYIVMNTLFKIISSSNPDERYRLADHLYRIFFPSLKPELDQEIKNLLLSENIKVYVPKPRDYAIYGTKTVLEWKYTSQLRLKEAFVRAVIQAVVTVMERHNLIEKPFEETAYFK